MTTTCSKAGSAASDQRAARVESSPNYKDGKFRNSLANEEPPFFETLGEWAKGGENTTPDGDVPTVPVDPARFAEPPASGLRVTWLGHSTTLVEIDGARVLTDPVWSERSSPFGWVGPQRFFAPPLAFDDLPEVDAVLISHDHYDHLDEDTVKRLNERGDRFIVPLKVGDHLRRWGVPDERIVELDWWESTEVGEVTVTATPARHFSGRSLVMADRDKTLWAGFAVHGPEHRVYYSGDTAMFPGFAEIGERLGPFDVAMLEVGAYNRLWADVHLGPEQAMRAARMARAELLLPVHWGTFDLAMHAWTEPAERLLAVSPSDGVPLVLPLPGQSVNPAMPPAPERWWPEVPWQTVEQHPVISSRLAEVTP